MFADPRTASQKRGDKTPSRPWLTAVLVLAVLLVFALLALQVVVSRQRRLLRRFDCAANMQHVATAAKIYGWDLLPRDPSAIERLIESGLVTRGQTICPSSGLTHSNYIVVPVESPGRGFDSSTPVMYEPKSNHGGEGGNFVFADGHASFARGKDYDELVKRATAYQRSSKP